ncbi:MAG: BON domain-containing protein [Gemmatimonadota bacterium]|nr:BON domain-containing protein [Gemmatimonadota bacterium]
MARDYEDLHNIEELDDNELRELVREQLREHAGLDIDEITVLVSQGKVTLSGRVGTDGERRVAEHVLTDVLGIEDYQNDLVVDQLARARNPEAADESIAETEERSGGFRGDVQVSMTDESAHLADGADDDLAGTSDYQQVMEDGLTYNPPSSPTAEGMLGSDAGPEDMGGRH